MQEFLDTLLNGPARYTQEHHLSPWWALAVVVGALLIEFGAAYLLARLIVFAFQHVQSAFAWALRWCGVGDRQIDHAFLQLTFPAATTKSAYATEQLHILMRSLVKYYGFWERAAGRKQPYSLELVATKNKGIRYVVMVPRKEAEIVKRTLLSFLPGLKVTEVEDYMSELSGASAGVVELKLSGDFILPLGDNKALAEHDPIAYLTGHMRSLDPSELVVFQIVAVPVFVHTHRNVLRHIQDAQRRIALGKQLSTELNPYQIDIGHLLLMTLLAPLWLLGMGFKFVAGIIEAVATNDLPQNWKSNGDKRRSDDPYEQELGATIKTKLDQHLFEVSMRILVATSEADKIHGRLEAIISSFETFSSSRQVIRVRRDIPLFAPGDKHLPRFRERILSPHIISQPTILSSSELSDLYHFPNTDLTKTEGLVKSRSRDLPAPLSLKGDNAQFDVVVGANEFGGEVQEIGMTLAQRQRHTYIIGKTGTGKTTLLMSSIYQDMANGKGLAVFDPHGDMFRELLSLVPEHRREDVVVFDPADREYPVGLNILDPGIDFKDEDDKHEWITSTVLSVFAKLADENQWGPRMEHILRNTTLTALQTPKPSLYTLQRLLTDKKYQKEVAQTLKDPVLKQFWEKEFKMLGSMQMSSATAPLTHRLGHFITAKMSRHILLKEKSTVRIADIMNEGKILLVNLSKGDIGEYQSFFFGTILTSFIWMAAYQRTKIPEKKRRDFFVYVDEFQNFATPQFGAITSEGRKFRISLIVSHQNIAQMEDKDLVKVVAGNAATIICLKANPEDEAFILPYMKPEVEKGDIVNLAPYHFYMKVSGDESEDAFSGQTVPLSVEGSEGIIQSVVAGSRKRYATPKIDVEKQMEKLFKDEPEKKPTKAQTSKKATKVQTPGRNQPQTHDV
jgi:hypothetical protein